MQLRRRGVERDRGNVWLEAIVAAAAASAMIALILAIYYRGRKIETVYPWEGALLYVNGAFQRQLAPGRHIFSSFARTIQVHRVSVVETPHPLGVIDVTTSDHFSLRLAPVVVARITNPRKVVEGQYLYAAKLKLAVAETLGTAVSKQNLDALLAEFAELGPIAKASVGPQFDEIEIISVHVPAPQLPPETRRLTTEVERARREGQAALERARSEHASLRALANAARLARDNPDLIRLRTLQSVSQAGKGATIVLAADPPSFLATQRRGPAK